MSGRNPAAGKLLCGGMFLGEPGPACSWGPCCLARVLTWAEQFHNTTCSLHTGRHPQFRCSLRPCNLRGLWKSANRGPDRPGLAMCSREGARCVAPLRYRLKQDDGAARGQERGREMGSRGRESLKSTGGGERAQVAKGWAGAACMGTPFPQPPTGASHARAKMHTCGGGGGPALQAAGARFTAAASWGIGACWQSAPC